MKRVFVVVLVLCLLLALCSCGKSSEVKKAEELILLIGEVTLESEALIDAAQIYYETLSDREREKVENYDVLVDAQRQLLELKEQLAAQQKEEEYNVLYEQALAYEQTDIVLAYEEYQKLPKEYKDVEIRMSELEPYINACGYWEYVEHTGSFAPEFYWLEVNFVEFTDDSKKIDATWYSQGGSKTNVRTFFVTLTDNGTICFQNIIYAATVRGKPNGDLIRKYEINGDILTFTYIYENTEVLGVYKYQRSDAPEK